MNEILEAMARALSKSWFVDFDPVRAKMESRNTNLPKHIADLFPERMVDSELGEIPEGWTVKYLRDLCHQPQYGYTASAKDKPVGPKFLRITDINKQPWIDWTKVPHCEANADQYSKYRLQEGDILIARMADPGHSVLIEENRGAVFASYLIRFRSVKIHHSRLLQYWLKSNAYWQLVKGQSAGTTRVSLNAQVLSSFPLLIPTDPIANTFAEQVDAIREAFGCKYHRDARVPCFARHASPKTHFRSDPLLRRRQEEGKCCSMTRVAIDPALISWARTGRTHGEIQETAGMGEGQ